MVINPIESFLGENIKLLLVQEDTAVYLTGILGDYDENFIYLESKKSGKLDLMVAISKIIFISLEDGEKPKSMIKMDEEPEGGVQ